MTNYELNSDAGYRSVVAFYEAEERKFRELIAEIQVKKEEVLLEWGRSDVCIQKK